MNRLLVFAGFFMLLAIFFAIGGAPSTAADLSNVSVIIFAISLACERILEEVRRR
jgi:hypothetical protein